MQSFILRPTISDKRKCSQPPDFQESSRCLSLAVPKNERMTQSATINKFQSPQFPIKSDLWKRVNAKPNSDEKKNGISPT